MDFEENKSTIVRVLPVLMIVAAICFGIRISQMIGESSLTQTSEMVEVSSADALTLAQIEPAADAAPPEQPAAAMNEAAPLKPEVQAPSLGAPPQKGDWKGAEDLDDEYSEVKMELFEDLTKRRRDLDKKEKDLQMREALLKATQAELEQKYQELTTIKTDIEELLKRQTEEENKRIASLVKIYEGMKAKDAARIFDTLDMDVLLQVMTKMSERKTAPILAAMDADKARNVTIMLAEQNKLPSLPNLGGATANP